jgi:chromate transport protein ChrA
VLAFTKLGLSSFGGPIVAARLNFSEVSLFLH